MMGNQVRRIESRENQTFKQWLRLQNSAAVKKTGQFLLSGRKLVPELLKSHPHRFTSLICKVGQLIHTDLIPTYELPAPLFREVDALGTDSPLLVGSYPEPQTFATTLPGAKVGLALQDPGNLGAALRSCLAFGIQNVVLFEEACHPYHMKALKAGAGAQFHLKLWKAAPIGTPSGLEKVIGLDLEGENLGSFSWPKDFLLVLGEEGPGLPKHIERRIKIPMKGPVESLNATTSLAIALYDWSQK